MGHKTDVAKRIQDLQPKAYPTHCHGHSLSFLIYILSAHGLPFEVFIDDPDVYCFVGDSTLKSKFPFE